MKKTFARRIQIATSLIAFVLLVFPNQGCGQPTSVKGIQFQVQSEVYPPQDCSEPSSLLNFCSSLVRVVLAPHQFSVQHEGHESVYDFEKETVTRIDHQNKTATILSLYAIPAFRVYEKRNREQINLIGEETNLAKLKVDPFRLESLFGDKANTVSGQALVKTEQDGTFHYTYKEEPVADYQLSSFSLAPSLKDIYHKYLLYSFSIHPRIVEALSKETKLFRNLTYWNQAEVAKFDQRQLRISDFKEFSGQSIIIPKSYDKKYALDARLDAVIKRSLKEPTPTEQSYISEMQALLAEGQAIEASFVFHEFSIQTGGKQLSSSMKQTIQQVFSEASPGSALLAVTNAIRKPPNSQASFNHKMRILETSRKTNPSHGYVLNVFMANYLSMTGQYKVSQSLILKALTENPFLTMAYNDLGDKYFRAYDMNNAWASWDHLRRLSLDPSVKERVNTLEKDLKENHPAYFQ